MSGFRKGQGPVSLLTSLLQTSNKILTFPFRSVDTVATRLPAHMERSPANSSSLDSTTKHNFAGLRNKSTRKRDRSAKESALIQAATELIAARGFERTTTREI